MDTTTSSVGQASSSSQQACLPAVGDVLAIVRTPRDSAAYVASRLAARDDGSVTGCAMTPAFLGARASRGEATVMALLESPPTVQRHDDLRTGGDGDAFIRLAASAGARQPQWTVLGQDPEHDLARLSAWHDLIVVQRPSDEGARPLDGLKALLLATHRPCLVLPVTCAPCGVFDRAVLAWDGSDPAARAIRSALPLIVAAREVVLLDGTRHDRKAEPVVFDPVAFLARHRVNVIHRRMQATAAEAGAALLKKARQAKADLLVMGAYGHSPLREQLFGGATQYVLTHATLATWLAH